MIKIIAAVDKNGAIGKNNELLYYIKEDLKNFKELTTNKVVVMGRNTWESLPIKPLPNRKNIVLTTSKDKLEGAKTLSSFKELKEYINNSEDEICIIGGASVYEQVLDENLVDEAHITFVRDEVEDADAYLSIDKIKDRFSKSTLIKTFEQENIKADYIVFSK